MKQYYPDLYLETAGELATLDYGQTDLSEEEARFFQEFACDTAQDPFEQIFSLFHYQDL